MSNTPVSTTTTGARFSVLAIVGFILSILLSIVGAIISLIAVIRINRTGERGRGLAIAGIIIGVVLFVFSIIQGNAILHMNGM